MERESLFMGNAILTVTYYAFFQIISADWREE